jgi:ankyrin repeat protein
MIVFVCVIAWTASLEFRSQVGSLTLTDVADAIICLLQVSLLLELGADPSCAAYVPGHPTEVTPLMLAAVRGNAVAVEKLIAREADCNRADSAGRTPLMYGARNGMVGTSAFNCYMTCQ